LEVFWSQTAPALLTVMSEIGLSACFNGSIELSLYFSLQTTYMPFIFLLSLLFPPSHPIHLYLILFCWLGRTSSVMLNRSFKRGYSYIYFTFENDDLLQIPFPDAPIFLRVFIINGCWILSNVFYVSVQIII
jgi:hypothetical protein